MGCLLVNIGSPHTADVSVAAIDLYTSATAVCKNNIVCVAVPGQEAWMNAEYVDAGLQTSVEYRNTTPSISIGLICAVSLDNWMYLQFEEGDAITIDGRYLKVLKA